MTFTKTLSQKDFDTIRKTIRSGVPFTATVDQLGQTVNLTGKIHLRKDENEFWLCFNGGKDGETSPKKYGYKHSWSIDRRNYDCIKNITIEGSIVTNYEIY